MTFDWDILNWIQTLHTPAGDVLMPYISLLGDGGMIWIIAGIVLTIFPRTRNIGIAVLIALILDVILCNGILKPLVARIRPCDIDTTVQLLIARPTDFSFPSGHTASSFAAASALFMQKSRFKIPALVLAVLIAFSRLYLFVHFPSDIAAGALVGIMCGAAGSYIAEKFIFGKVLKKC